MLLGVVHTHCLMLPWRGTYSLSHAALARRLATVVFSNGNKTRTLAWYILIVSCCLGVVHRPTHCLMLPWHGAWLLLSLVTVIKPELWRGTYSLSHAALAWYILIVSCCLGVVHTHCLMLPWHGAWLLLSLVTVIKPELWRGTYSLSHAALARRLVSVVFSNCNTHVRMRTIDNRNP